MKLFVLLALVFSVVFGKSADVGCLFGRREKLRIESLNSPISEHYGEMANAKNPWNSVFYGGKLYIASGDYTQSSGNTPIFTYDAASCEWVEAFVTSDDSLDVFRIIDGRLFAVGNDSTASYNLGNYYVLDGDTWTAYGDVPNAAHVFDVAQMGDRLFFGIGTRTGALSPAVCLDSEGIYSSVPFVKGGESLFPSDAFSYSRVYNFFVLDGTLYAFLVAVREDGGRSPYEFYRYDGEVFSFVSELDGKGVGFYKTPVEEKQKRLSQNFIAYGFERDGYAYFATGALYRTKDFISFERLSPKSGAWVSDVAELGGSRYALGFMDKRLSDGFYCNYIWRLESDGSFTEIAEFITDGTYALSLAGDGDVFFVGMGNRAAADGVGEIYKITVGG